MASGRREAVARTSVSDTDFARESRKASVQSSGKEHKTKGAPASGSAGHRPGSQSSPKNRRTTTRPGLARGCGRIARLWKTGSRPRSPGAGSHGNPAGGCSRVVRPGPLPNSKTGNFRRCKYVLLPVVASTKLDVMGPRAVAFSSDDHRNQIGKTVCATSLTRTRFVLQRAATK